MRSPSATPSTTAANSGPFVSDLEWIRGARRRIGARLRVLTGRYLAEAIYLNPRSALPRTSASMPVWAFNESRILM